MVIANDNIITDIYMPSRQVWKISGSPKKQNILLNLIFHFCFCFCFSFSYCHSSRCEIRAALSGPAATVSRFVTQGACWICSCFCNPPNSDMDYRIFIVRAWSSACVHTLDLGLTSHPKDGVHSALAYARSLIPNFCIFAVSIGFDPAPFGSLELETNA